MERYILVWATGIREILSYTEIGKIFARKPSTPFKVWCDYKGEQFLCGAWNGKEMC